MQRHIIYFDIDGVLADFDAGVFNVAGVDLALHGPDAFADKELKDKVFAHPTFFLDLPVLPGTHDMVNYAMGYGDVQALTATGYSNEEAVAAQKVEWIKRNFPQIKEVHTVPKSGDKAKYAWPDIILIDDRLEKSVMPFREKGGIGIHHTSVANTKAQLDKYFTELGQQYK